MDRWVDGEGSTAIVRQMVTWTSNHCPSVCCHKMVFVTKRAEAEKIIVCQHIHRPCASSHIHTLVYPVTDFFHTIKHTPTLTQALPQKLIQWYVTLILPMNYVQHSSAGDTSVTRALHWGKLCVSLLVHKATLLEQPLGKFGNSSGWGRSSLCNTNH